MYKLTIDINNGTNIDAVATLLETSVINVIIVVNTAMMIDGGKLFILLSS